MATLFLEPGGDGTFIVNTTVNSGFWATYSGATVVTDFVHGGHLKSYRHAPGVASALGTGQIVSDTGARISFYLYLAAIPNATAGIIAIQSAAQSTLVELRLTSAGVLQLWNKETAQIGTNGSTLSTGIWYRISLAYTITSTTVNRFELFKDAVSDISITNATLTATGTSRVKFGNINGNATIDFRSSDHYIDNSSALTDPGNIWVTAKRPNANGTTNNFSTRIGAGGSGYGTGKSPQVNERALSTTNGWSVVAVGVTVEEYNIEAASVGDIDISAATIVDYIGWVDTKALVAENASLILNNVLTAIAITTTITIFTAVAGSTTYPAGTGKDIGMQTDATATTVSLYECGVLVAYIPAATSSVAVQSLPLLGVG